MVTERTLAAIVSFSKDKRVNEWWAKMMPLQGAPSFDDKVLHRKIDLIPNNDLDPKKIDRVMLKRNRVSRIYYQNIKTGFCSNINKEFICFFEKTFEMTLGKKRYNLSICILSNIHFYSVFNESQVMKYNKSGL
ncbi:MAG TPA: hypothetical protein PKZ15_03070 [Paludibacteraceae bacterium]|nr:hypothetical protein [Paludibacteraceae bacterium]